MTMYIVRRKVGQGGVTVMNQGDACLVSATDEAEARTLAGTDQPGGVTAWADAEVLEFDETILDENGGIVRFQTTSSTPSEASWITE